MYLSAAVTGVPSIVSPNGSIYNKVQTYLVHQSSFLSSVCSGISEMLRLSIELLTVANDFLAEKA